MGYAFPALKENELFAGELKKPEYDFTQPVNISDRFAIDFVKRDNEKETVVRFIDRKYNQITTGSYYISTIIEHKKGYGLTLDGGFPEWTVDAIATTKAIEICEYYKNTTLKLHLTTLKDKILKSRKLIHLQTVLNLLKWAFQIRM